MVTREVLSSSPRDENQKTKYEIRNLEKKFMLFTAICYVPKSDQISQVMPVHDRHNS